LKGVFVSISQRSKQPEKQYILASKMNDIHLGDTHLISLEDCTLDDDTSYEHYVALIVAQRQNKFNFSALQSGRITDERREDFAIESCGILFLALKSLAKSARAMKASVHLPRIGVGSTGFNWYGTEKLIQKYLSSRGIPTYIYYFQRNKKRKLSQHLDVHLPSYFSNLHLFFHDIDEQTVKRLKRFVYAYVD